MGMIILWTQTESYASPDILIVNGKICYDNDESFKKHYRRFQFISKFPIDKNLNSGMFSEYIVKYKLSYNYKIYIKDNDFYLQATFLNVDEDGRREIYVYFNNVECDINLKIEKLKDYAEKINKNLSIADINIQNIRAISSDINLKKKYKCNNMVNKDEYISKKNSIKNYIKNYLKKLWEKR